MQDEIDMLKKAVVNRTGIASWFITNNNGASGDLLGCMSCRDRLFDFALMKTSGRSARGAYLGGDAVAV